MHANPNHLTFFVLTLYFISWDRSSKPVNFPENRGSFTSGSPVMDGPFEYLVLAKWVCWLKSRLIMTDDGFDNESTPDQISSSRRDNPRGPRIEDCSINHHGRTAESVLVHSYARSHGAKESCEFCMRSWKRKNTESNAQSPEGATASRSRRHCHLGHTYARRTGELLQEQNPNSIH